MKLKRYVNDIKKLTKHFGLCFALKCTVKRIVSFSRYERFVFDYLSDYFQPVVSGFQKNYASAPQNREEIPREDAFEKSPVWERVRSISQKSTTPVENHAQEEKKKKWEELME